MKAKDDDDMFVQKVFDNWLNQDYENLTDSTVPQTGRSCAEATPDLHGSLMKEIRDHFCSQTMTLYSHAHVVRNNTCTSWTTSCSKLVDTCISFCQFFT